MNKRRQMQEMLASDGTHGPDCLPSTYTTPDSPCFSPGSSPEIYSDVDPIHSSGCPQSSYEKKGERVDRNKERELESERDTETEDRDRERENMNQKDSEASI